MAGGPETQLLSGALQRKLPGRALDRTLFGEPLRAWLALAALSLLFFHITAATFTSLGVVLPTMVGELHWSWSEAGLGYTLLAVACGLASLAPAVIIRALGARVTLIVGGVVLGAGLYAFAVVRTAEAYLIGAVLAGVGFALAAVIPGTFVLARAFRRPALPFGLYFTVGGLGGAAGPLLARLGVEHAWRGYWLQTAGVGVVLAAIAAAAVAPAWSKDVDDAGDRRPELEGFTLGEALATPQFWIIAFAYTAYLLCGTTVNYASVEQLTDRGVPAAAAAALLAVENLLNAASRAAGGLAGERIAPKRLTLIGLGGLALGASALAVAHGPLSIGLYVLGAGVGYGLAFLASTVLLLTYFGRRRNLELFSLMCLISTTAAAGPWFAGFSKDRLGGFAPALWAFAGVALIAFTAVLLLKPPLRRRGSPVPAIEAEVEGRLAKDIA